LEASLVNWFGKRLPRQPSQRVGIGDDAAVLRWGAGPDCVVTVDVVMDGVDFDLATVDPRRVGRKAIAINLSDLAAMAATPVAAVIGLVLPREGGAALARELYEGLIPLAEQYQVALAGGDVNSWDGQLAISVTVLGQATDRGALTRSGAKPGDQIIVTGEFGGSILGRHLDFEPRVQEALKLHREFDIHAAIDVSDGLSLDLSRMAEASGCGAVVHLTRVPISQAAHARSKETGAAPMEHALSDGEDFELILAIPPKAAAALLASQPLPGVPLTCIGELTDDGALWQVDDAGVRSRLIPKGYEHRLSP